MQLAKPVLDPRVAPAKPARLAIDYIRRCARAQVLAMKAVGPSRTSSKFQRRSRADIGSAKFIGASEEPDDRHAR